MSAAVPRCAPLWLPSAPHSLCGSIKGKNKTALKPVPHHSSEVDSSHRVVTHKHFSHVERKYAIVGCCVCDSHCSDRERRDKSRLTSSAEDTEDHKDPAKTPLKTEARHTAHAVASSTEKPKPPPPESLRAFSYTMVSGFFIPLAVIMVLALGCGAYVFCADRPPQLPAKYLDE